MNDIKFNSKNYWENRYKIGCRVGDDSGIGSHGILAEYKASIINNFIKDNNIQTLCDLGCGDTQFLLFNVPNYTGYDVSEFIIERNKSKYKFKFKTLIEELTTYDLVISLDVIYHLIEDDVYNLHMKDLFRLSNKYVIIYSPNKNDNSLALHNKYREFLKDIPQNFKLELIINNPHKGKLTQSDFYIFKHI